MILFHIIHSLITAFLLHIYLLNRSKIAKLLLPYLRFLVEMNANNHVGFSQAVTLNSALSERASVKPTFKLLPACAAAEELWISYYRLKPQ